MLDVTALGRYEIGAIHHIEPINKNRALLVVTESGKFMLSTIRFSSQIQRLFYDHAFTHYLVQQGFPARRILKTRDGKLACQVQEMSYFLVEYFDGNSADSRNHLSVTQVSECAKQLARLHSLSQHYSGPKYSRLPFNSRKSYNTLQQVKAVIEQKSFRSEFDLLTEIAIEVKMENIAKHSFEKCRFLELPFLVNHGDYHAGNVIFGPQDVITAIVDFEYCRSIPRVWDVAWALTWFCRKRFTEAFSGCMDMDKLTAFLASYHSEYPLSCKEQNSLCELAVSASFHTTYLLEHHYLRSQDINVLDVEPCSDLSEWFWWVRNKDALMSTISSTCVCH